VTLTNIVAGALVGILVGLTGVGGGSLMSPILILMFGVAPATAVGTDLWFAAATKSVGGAVHHRQGSTDWPVVRLLCLGSLPAAALTALWLGRTEARGAVPALIPVALGALLVLTAVATPFRDRLARRLARGRAQAGERGWPTVLVGAVLGTLVTLTSVGAGALGVSALMLLYPTRMTTRRLVGTDIVHAVPLTLVAGAGHLWLGNVDFALLGSLLAGSIPGIVLGSSLAGHLPERIVRPVLATVLFAVGLRLMVA